MTKSHEARIEAAAKAMESAELGYHLRLTGLVDGVHTYTLTYDDGTPPLNFDNIDDGYAHIASKRRLAQATAAITAYLAGDVVVPREETTAMLAAGQKAWVADELKRSSTLYRAMVSAATEMEQK